MNTVDSITKTSGTRSSLRVLSATFLCLFLYGSFFYYLVREQLSWMMKKQAALESIKVLTIPGSSFLSNLGWPAPLYGSLFYIVLLGTMLLVFLLISLLFASPLKRGIFLSLGFLALAVSTFGDRVWIPFAAVVLLSFGSFFVLTLPCRIRFTAKEIGVFLLVVVCVSLSLLFGAREQFFLKARDKVLFDSALGNKVVSFYYQYSPLAVSVLSPEKGVYQGLLYDPEIKDGNLYLVGKGVFVGGNPAIVGYKDFTMAKQGNGFSLESRHGKRVASDSLTPAEVEKAIDSLFDMKGFVLLSKVALYLFPGALLILVSLSIRWLTRSQKVFVAAVAALGLVMVAFIWTVSLTGYRLPPPDRLGSSDISKVGLNVAYFLDKKTEIPPPYVVVVRRMTQSQSPALRYWGVRLLGSCGTGEDVNKVIQLLDDPVPNVRYTAAQALYKLSRTESFNALVHRLLTDPSWYVRCKVYSLFLQAGVIPAPA